MQGFNHYSVRYAGNAVLDLFLHYIERKNGVLLT